jgi:hypothetical protein
MEHTHGSAKTTIDLEHSKLVKVIVVVRLGKTIIGYNLVIGGGLDTIPVTDKTQWFEYDLLSKKGNNTQIHAFCAF